MKSTCFLMNEAERNNEDDNSRRHDVSIGWTFVRGLLMRCPVPLLGLLPPNRGTGHRMSKPLTNVHPIDTSCLRELSSSLFLSASFIKKHVLFITFAPVCAKGFHYPP